MLFSILNAILIIEGKTIENKKDLRKTKEKTRAHKIFWFSKYEQPISGDRF